jgi:hypothetical protein
MMKANREIMLMETPKVGKKIMLMETPKVGKSIRPAIKEMGIPSVTQKARRAFRNIPKSRLTRIRPRAIFFSNSRILLFSILDGVLIGDPVDFDKAGCFALKSGKKIHILEAISELGDLSQGDLAAIGPGNYCDISIITRVVTATLGPDQDFTSRRLDTARR